MTDKAEQIAAGLTQAMREAVAHPESEMYFWCADRRTEKAIERRGLIGAWTFQQNRKWPPLGQQVREILIRESQS